MKTLLLTLLFISQTTTFARPDRERVPPEEAISVCEGKEAQTSCSIEGRDGEQLTGTCEHTPDNKYFACKPPRRERERQ